MADNNEKDIFKNLILAGVGALAMTAEKISESITELQEVGKITAEQGKEIIDELAKKGEITIEQGKKIVEQLKTADKETGVAENDIDRVVEDKSGVLKRLLIAYTAKRTPNVAPKQRKLTYRTIRKR